MFNYLKLWVKVEKAGMTRLEFKDAIGMSTATLAKLGKNQYVSMEVLERICDYFNCQPGDIMEFVRDDDVIKLGQEFNKQIDNIFSVLSEKTGLTKEQIVAMTGERFTEEQRAILLSDDYAGIGKIEERAKKKK